MVNYEITIKNCVIGTELSLKSSGVRKTYVRWSVEDHLNGLSHTENIDDTIVGFYKAGRKVKLYLYDRKNNCRIIENVLIKKGG